MDHGLLHLRRNLSCKVRHRDRSVSDKRRIPLHTALDCGFSDHGNSVEGRTYLGELWLAYDVAPL